MDFYSVNGDFRMSQSKKILIDQISDKIYKMQNIRESYMIFDYFVKICYYSMWLLHSGDMKRK